MQFSRDANKKKSCCSIDIRFLFSLDRLLAFFPFFLSSLSSSPDLLSSSVTFPLHSLDAVRKNLRDAAANSPMVSQQFFGEKFLFHIKNVEDDR